MDIWRYQKFKKKNVITVQILFSLMVVAIGQLLSSILLNFNFLILKLHFLLFKGFLKFLTELLHTFISIVKFCEPTLFYKYFHHFQNNSYIWQGFLFCFSLLFPNTLSYEIFYKRIPNHTIPNQHLPTQLHGLRNRNSTNKTNLSISFPNTFVCLLETQQQIMIS